MGSLSVDELLKQVNREYSITTTVIKPHNSVWRLYAPNQSYLLKRIRTNPQKFAQLAQIISEFQKSSSSTFVPILLTKKGTAYIKVVNTYYMLSPWVEGKKPSFNNHLHLKMIAQCFGKLHFLSRSMTFPPEMSNDNLLEEYEKKQFFLESLFVKIDQQKNLNRIDRTILHWGEHFLNQGRYCIAQLSKLKGDQLQQEKGFCHNDPAPGNIIIQNKNCYLIDFEFSTRDLFIKEFTILLNRALQANRWDLKTADLLITTYILERPFIVDELKILPYLLCFPRRFWRICYQRYQERLDWTEKRFQRRLWEIIAEEKDRFRFLKTWLPELAGISGPELGGAE